MWKLLIQNIVDFIRRDKGIFVIFILSEICISLSLLYIVGINKAFEASNTAYDEDIRTITVSWNFMGDASPDEGIQQILREKGKEISNIHIFMGDFILDSEDPNEQEPQPVFCRALPATSRMYLGSYFTAEDMENAAFKVVIGDTALITSAYPYHVGDSIGINGQSYEITGFMFNSTGYEVPYLRKDDFGQVEKLDVVLKDVPSGRDITRWHTYLQSVFGNVHPELLKEEDSLQSSFINFEFAASIFICIIAFFNLSFIYAFILQKRRRQYAVCRMVGCSLKKGVFLFSGELLLLTAVQYIITVLVFAYLLSPFLFDAQSGIVNVMGMTDYVLLFVFYVASALLVFIPNIYGFCKKTPMDLYRGAI